jgi:hypothetical protein
MHRCLWFLAALTLALTVPSPAGAFTDHGSGVWAGVVDYGPATRIAGDFVIPARTTACGSTSAAAVWIGLGGNGERTLAQLGLTLTTAGVGAWYETIDSTGAAREVDVPFHASTWDHIHLAVAFVNNRTTLRLRWQNYTTGENDLIVLTGAGRYWSSRSAEWIVERVGTAPLAHFGAIKWTNAWYGQEATTVDAQAIDERVNVLGDTDDLTAVTLPADDRSVTDWWRACR